MNDKSSPFPRIALIFLFSFGLICTSPLPTNGIAQRTQPPEHPIATRDIANSHSNEIISKSYISKAFNCLFCIEDPQNHATRQSEINIVENIEESYPKEEYESRLPDDAIVEMSRQGESVVPVDEPPINQNLFATVSLQPASSGASQGTRSSGRSRPRAVVTPPRLEVNRAFTTAHNRRTQSAKDMLAKIISESQNIHSEANSLPAVIEQKRVDDDLIQSLDSISHVLPVMDGLISHDTTAQLPIVPHSDRMLTTENLAVELEKQEEHDDNEGCSICYDPLSDADKILLPCGHDFHSRCYFSFCPEANRCPLKCHESSVDFTQFSEQCARVIVDTFIDLLKEGKFQDAKSLSTYLLWSRYGDELVEAVIEYGNEELRELASSKLEIYR